MRVTAHHTFRLLERVYISSKSFECFAHVPLLILTTFLPRMNILWRKRVHFPWQQNLQKMPFCPSSFLTVKLYLKPYVVIWAMVIFLDNFIWKMFGYSGEYLHEVLFLCLKCFVGKEGGLLPFLRISYLKNVTFFQKTYLQRVTAKEMLFCIPFIRAH